MFQADDVVVYGNNGICKVTDVGTISLSGVDKQRKYYTLRPVYQSETVYYVPVENQKTNMRLVITKDEAEQLIEDIATMESAWIVNEKEREAQYKEALRSCDCRELIKIIKTLYQRKQLRIQDGKKVTTVDERYFHLAETQLYEELGYALGMAKEEVSAYITNHITQEKIGQ